MRPWWPHHLVTRTWVGQTQVTSPCYHLVTLKLTPIDTTSSCYHHVSSVCVFEMHVTPSNPGWYARSLTRQTIMTVSPCDSKFASPIAPQTKMLEGRTNISERIFEALFKRVSTGFGLQTLKSASKMRSEMFVRPSNIFVWGA